MNKILKYLFIAVLAASAAWLFLSNKENLVSEFCDQKKGCVNSSLLSMSDPNHRDTGLLKVANGVPIFYLPRRNNLSDRQAKSYSNALKSCEIDIKMFDWCEYFLFKETKNETKYVVANCDPFWSKQAGWSVPNSLEVFITSPEGGPIADEISVINVENPDANLEKNLEAYVDNKVCPIF